MPKRRSSKKPSKKVIIGAAAAAVILIAIFAGSGKDTVIVDPPLTPEPTVTAYETVAAVTQIPVTASPAPTAVPTAAPTDIPTLKKGSTGEAVKALQERLISLGYLSGTADGDFGPATAQAVKDFQLVNNLTEDGVAGPETIGRIMGRYAIRNGTVFKTSSGSVYHVSSTCSGMKSPQSLTLVEARRQGLTPCDRCH